MIEFLNEKLPEFTKIRITEYNRIAIKMPIANQQLSEKIIGILLKITGSYLDDNYCFLCFDPDHMDRGEIGLELYPGCTWEEARENAKRK